ncbi:MAG: hypothetical protein HY320_13125 [Armatimonadetes bacterium]|nr:hypothetical protein [Armatimonadota bacterium]
MAQHYPWRGFVAEWLARGVIPLWNPHQFCGSPFLANGQGAPLYPIHALFALPLGATTAARMGWVAALHLTLAGLFTHLWVRRLGAGTAGAVVAGLAFMLSGFATAWLCLPSFLSAGCWIPLALLLAEDTVVKRNPWRAVWLGGALGLVLLGGHLQIALYGLLAVGLRVGIEVGRHAWRRKARAAAGMAGLGALALTVGLAVAAPQLAPAFELARLSHRASPPTEEGYAGYVGYALPPVQMVGLLAPQTFGQPLHGTYWGAASYAEYAGSVGIVAVLLAAVGLFARWRPLKGSPGLFPALLAVLSLLIALGTPLNRLLYFGIPGFGQTGAPARILALFCLGMAALAGLGLNSLVAMLATGDPSAIRRLIRAAALGGGAVAALLVVAWVGIVGFAEVHASEGLPALAADGMAPSLRLAAGGAIVGALLLAAAARGRLVCERAATALAVAAISLVALEMLLVAPGVVPSAPAGWAYPETPETQRLRADVAGGRIATLNQGWSLRDTPPRAVFPPNAALVYRLRDAAGYDSLHLGRYRAFTTRLCGRDAAPPENGNMVLLPPSALRSPLFPLLGASLAVTLGPGGTWTVYRYPQAREAYLAHAWRSAADKEGLDWLEQRLSKNANARIAIVAREGADGSGPGGEVLSDERPSPNRRRLRVRAAGLGLLILAEGWAPGWRARLRLADGQARTAPVLRANVAFQAVAVPAGETTVELTYAPASFRAGLFLAGLAVAALAAGLLPCARPGIR